MAPVTRWFRFYDEALDDPKVQRLPGDLFKFWVNVLCLASRNEGRLPPIEDIAFALRTDDRAVGESLDMLHVIGLIDILDDEVATPHNWGGRQFHSDCSTERVKQHRNKKRNVSETAGETPPEQSRADSEQKSTAATPPPDPFEEFRRVYPKRDGDNPWKPAKLKFERIIRNGADPQHVIAAARAYAAKNPTPTTFVAQAVTWLNQERWKDMEPTGPPPGVGPTVEEIFAAARAKHAAAGTG
jgi:hypothetical protein